MCDIARDAAHQDTPFELRVKAKRYRDWAARNADSSDARGYIIAAESMEREADIIERRTTLQQPDTGGRP